MPYRPFLPVAAALFLAGCASSYWPGQNARDASASDYPVIEQRYEAASKKVLGSARDVAEIKRVLLHDHPEMSMVDIRWVSVSEVIVYTESGKGESLGYSTHYCGFEKDSSGWHLVGCYLYLIS